MAETKPLDKAGKRKAKKTSVRPYFGTLQVRQPGVITRTKLVDKETKPPSLLPLLLYAGVLEVLYLLIVAVTAVPSLHLFSTPLVTVWTWTLFPFQLLFGTLQSSVGTASGQSWFYTLLLGVALIAVTGVYALG